MLQGFEEQTEELTAYDLAVAVPAIAKGLSLRIGRARAVTNKAMAAGLKKNGYKSMSSAKIRKIINYIRRNWLVPCLMATNKGYYVATDAEEMEEYEKSLRGRINEMSAVLDALKQQRKQYFKE